MVVGDRVKDRMGLLGFSQAELARRVGLAQPTIYGLIHSNKIGSKYLHRIARELGTTPAFLSGETDDPDADAPPAPELDHEERELVDLIRGLGPKDRGAILQLARTIATSASSSTIHAGAGGWRGREDQR